MAPQRLPQEVIDHIVDCLYFDVKSLANCALVSKNWTPRARRNIFAEVTLTFGNTTALNARFTRLQEIVRQNPEIGLLPRRLTLVGDESARSARAVDFLDQDLSNSFPASWKAAYAPSIAQLFPNIREVAVMKFFCVTLAGISEAIIEAFPALVALSFDTLKFFVPPIALTTWLPSQGPIASGPGPGRRSTFRKLIIRRLHISRRWMQYQSFALAQSLARLGALSALDSLELLSGPGVTQTWLPFLPSIGTHLQHCTITVNDVVPGLVGFYDTLTEQQLREAINDCYDALLTCPNLRSLRIKYDGFPTFRNALPQATVDPEGFIPCISPFFLQALSALLSRADVPFPRLETLAFDIFSTVEGLALCRDAWTVLGDALCARQRYPHFGYLQVELEEMGAGYGPWRDIEKVKSRDAGARAALLRAQLGRFEESGVMVSVATRDSKLYMW